MSDFDRTDIARLIYVWDAYRDRDRTRAEYLDLADAVLDVATDRVSVDEAIERVNSEPSQLWP